MEQAEQAVEKQAAQVLVREDSMVQEGMASVWVMAEEKLLVVQEGSVLAGGQWVWEMA